MHGRGAVEMHTVAHWNACANADASLHHYLRCGAPSMMLGFRGTLTSFTVETFFCARAQKKPTGPQGGFSSDSGGPAKIHPRPAEAGQPGRPGQPAAAPEIIKTHIPIMILAFQIRNGTETKTRSDTLLESRNLKKIRPAQASGRSAGLPASRSGPPGPK